jgi:small subunit ribosomal protein S20
MQGTVDNARVGADSFVKAAEFATEVAVGPRLGRTVLGPTCISARDSASSPIHHSSNPGESRPTGTTVPNTESAKKRVRQSAKSNARNLWRKRRIKDASGEFLKAVATGDAAAAEKAMRSAARTLDKIAATGTIHKNTAARRKSRMAAKLASLKKGK